MAEYPEYRQSRQSLRHQRARHAGRRDRGGRRHGRLRGHDWWRARRCIVEKHLARFLEGRASPTSRRSGTRCTCRRLLRAQGHRAQRHQRRRPRAVGPARQDAAGTRLPAPRRAVRDELSSTPRARGPTSPRRWASSAARCRCTTAPPKARRGCAQNLEMLADMRDKVGDDFWLMFDCWMSLDLDYATRLAHRRAPSTASSGSRRRCCPTTTGATPSCGAGAAGHAGHDRRARGDALGLPAAARNGLLRHHPARRRLVRRDHRAAANLRARRRPRRAGRPARLVACTATTSSSRATTARSPSS